MIRILCLTLKNYSKALANTDADGGKPIALAAVLELPR
jgi:hypothetical protein